MMSDFETIIKPTVIKQSDIKIEKDPLGIDPNEYEYHMEYQEQKPSESELESATITYKKVNECVEHQDRKPSELELENASITYTQCVTTNEKLCIKNEIESFEPSENQHNSFSIDDIPINNLVQPLVPIEEIKRNKSTQELKTEQVKFSEKELEKLRRLATAAERTRQSLPTYASITYTQCATTDEKLCIKNEIESFEPSENQHNSFSIDDIPINTLVQPLVPIEEIKRNKSTQELKTEQVKFSEKELEKLRRLATAAERTRRSLPTYASITYTQCATTDEKLCIKNEIESFEPSENQHNSFSIDDIPINNLAQPLVPIEEIKRNKSTQELKTEQVKFSEKELEKLRRLATAAERTRRSLPTFQIDRRDTMVYYLTMKRTTYNEPSNKLGNKSKPKTVAGRLDCKQQRSLPVESTKFCLVPFLKRSLPVESTKFSAASSQQRSLPVGKLSTVHFRPRRSTVETTKLSPAPSTVKQYSGRIYANKSPLVWIE